MKRNRLYNFLASLARLSGKTIYRFTLTGAENIPKEGAFLLCANHIHGWDAAAMAAASPRRLQFIAKSELFNTWIGRKFFTACGAFPVQRDTADMQAYRNSMAVLKSGEGLMIFSQGTRMSREGFDNAKGGVAMFALKSGAPIIPAGIRGRYYPFAKLDVHIGKPIYMDKYAGRKIKAELLDEVMEEVSAQILSLSQKGINPSK